jgi:hypothetical protein
VDHLEYFYQPFSRSFPIAFRINALSQSLRQVLKWLFARAGRRWVIIGYIKVEAQLGLITSSKVKTRHHARNQCVMIFWESGHTIEHKFTLFNDTIAYMKLQKKPIPVHYTYSYNLYSHSYSPIHLSLVHPTRVVMAPALRLRQE